MQADRWANRLTDREMAGWIGGLAGGKEGRQVGKQTDRQRNGWVDSTRRVGGWECRQTGGQNR